MRRINWFAGMTVVLALAFAAAALVAQENKDKKEEPKVIKKDSGLEITIVEEAKDPGAKSGDIVWVHYTGKLTNGKVFDSSVSREPFRFNLGAGAVIKGWDEGVVGMKVGEKRKLTIPPALGYGERGAGNDIPANATLVFDVELIGIARVAQK